jgi:hypothetical protein
MLYDLFICHAAEDKDAFVRPLANTLRAKNVSVWYDEFSLRIGDSIRRSIDAGLSQSRFGVVVLSKAFFQKKWPQYELDGLAEREMAGPSTVILPVWFKIEKKDVLAFSPSLANRVAARSADGLDIVVAKLVDVIHPQGSPIVEAWRSVMEWGKSPPSITDPYWLRVVEASNRVPAFGAAIPNESAWGIWSFPLPGRDDTPEEWGSRLAWTALQLDWVEVAEHNNICVISHPDEVYDFITSSAGLFETCCDFPDLTAEYAPQLTIPAFSRDLSEAFDKAVARSVEEATRRRNSSSQYGTSLTTDSESPLCEEEWSLRHPTFGNYRASTIANAYFAGSMFGPTVSPWEHADHMFWLLSDASAWLPAEHHQKLTEGMAEWGVWPWYDGTPLREGSWKSAGSLFNALHRAGEGCKFSWTSAVRGDVRGRIALAAERLDLPDAVSTIEARFVESPFVPTWIDSHKRRKRSGRKPAV